MKFLPRPVLLLMCSSHAYVLNKDILTIYGYSKHMMAPKS